MWHTSRRAPGSFMKLSQFDVAPPRPELTHITLFGVLLLENPGIPLIFRIPTVSLKVLDLKFKVLDETI
ncbi:Uncharacterized protein HZ326_26028 [Fusarium oxysporum f. sp. albedinis]|nr:Uncharacterized protein HZ326_26028 [Fusarium oxysporum f. sp. albedinis]